MDVADLLENNARWQGGELLCQQKRTWQWPAVSWRQCQGDPDALDDMLAPDFVSHNKLLRGQEPGRENFKRAVSAYRVAVSNPSIHFEDQGSRGRQGGDPLAYNGHPRSGESHRELPLLAGR